MATKKTGLDYFPFDVDFFSDSKIEFISARFGVKGEILTIRLLCRIYREGYFLPWNDDESTLFAKRAGDQVTPSLVHEVVMELIKRDFFDKVLFDRFQILTSRGIQRRYLEATSRRKSTEIDSKFRLNGVKCIHDVNILTQNVDIMSKNVDISTTKERKGKERIREESNFTHTREENFDLIKEKILAETFLEGACISQKFEKEKFKKFATAWLEKKRITEDFQYTLPQLKRFLIEDFQKNKDKDGEELFHTGNPKCPTISKERTAL